MWHLQTGEGILESLLMEILEEEFLRFKTCKPSRELRKKLGRQILQGNIIRGAEIMAKKFHGNIRGEVRVNFVAVLP